MKRIFQVIIGLVAIAAGVWGAWYGRTTYLDSVVTIQLPVPKADIDPYTILTPELLAWREYPRALVEEQHGYATDPDQLTGKISTSKLVAGLPVPRQLVAVPADYRLAASDLEVVSIPVTPEMSVGGRIKIGDQVNVYRLTAWEEQTHIAASETRNAEKADPIQIIVPLPNTLAADRPMTFTEVELIATVPVVQILSDDGTSEANDGEEPYPLQILVLAALPEIVQQILEAQAATTVGNNLLWLTLALPE